MPRTPDDDALSWAGEEADPTLARSPEPQRAVPRRSDAPPRSRTGRASALGATAARRAAASGSTEDADGTRDAERPAPRARLVEDEASPEASPEVVGLAFFGAVMVLEAIAWFLVVRDNPSSAGSAFQVGVAQATEALAVLAPLLWLAAVIAAGRGMRTSRRMLVLAAGAVVLFPWPWLVTR